MTIWYAGRAAMDGLDFQGWKARETERMLSQLMSGNMRDFHLLLGTRYSNMHKVRAAEALYLMLTGSALGITSQRHMHRGLTRPVEHMCRVTEERLGEYDDVVRQPLATNTTHAPMSSVQLLHNLHDLQIMTCMLQNAP